MKVFVITLTILFGVLSLSAQDLDRAWLAYTGTSSEIATLITRHQTLQTEQLKLLAEMDRLQTNSTWYNGWLNKLLLSGNTQRQLEIIKTLADLDARLNHLTEQHGAEFRELKAAYAHIISDYETTGSISPDLRLTAQNVGNLIFGGTPESISLPDYSSLVNGDYDNPALRGLVLEDVKIVLSTKLAQLDSLLDKLEAEEELAGRLVAFHEDLGLQLEGSRDIQVRDESGEPTKNFSWNSASEVAAMDGVGDGADLSYQDRQSTAGDALALRVGHESIEPTTEGQAQGNKLSYLQSRRSEYEALLQQINKELRESP